MRQKLEQVIDWPRRAKKAKWRVETLAKKFRVSRKTLARFVWKRFGVSPRDWLRQMRIQRAGKRLAKNLSVKRVSSEAGYKNQHHFSREFKKVTAIRRASTRREAGNKSRRGFGGRRSRWPV